MKKAVILILLILLNCSLFAQQKYALVIGNSNYSGISKLNNPLNDANDMESALKGLGFSVDKILNGSLDQMENAIVSLTKKLGASRGAYGFFFYAGHGVQSNGENYLIPIDASSIQTENHLRQRAVSVQAMLDNLNDAGNTLNVIVLDACRDNPFGWARSGSRGLAYIGHAPADSIIVFATGAGSTAADGTGRNGLFTGHLLNNLKTSGLEVQEMFRRTMGDVARASDNRQRPEYRSQFYETAYLGSKPAAQASVPAQPTTTQPVTPAPVTQTAPASQPPIITPAVSTERLSPTEMVRIHGGTFTMGSPASEKGRNSNEAQHQVTVSPFYMGKYEVTQKEYQEVMGVNPSHFKGDNLPVENVSWFNAIEYCNKRSQREGLLLAYTISGSGNNRIVNWNRNANGYRLSTEAEWEYACRAMTVLPFSSGNNITTYQANYDGRYPYNRNVKGEYRKKTIAVGSFPANPWGLYDMHGNVWEWCWDWYGTYLSDAQDDPPGKSTGSNRINRGGSWRNSEQYIRSAHRDYITPSYLSDSLGFRLVRNGE